MLKKEVTYTDFDGVTRTQDFYFNLTKVELIEFVLPYPEDIKQYIQEIANDPDKTRFVEMFKRLMKMAYGKRDGARFIKTPEMAEEFTHTDAYSELFLELFKKPGSLISFFNGVLGVDIEKLVAEAEAAEAEAKKN